ncbi:MAG: hypothetical protein H7066_19795 [Cytophagaceae bacterium]|nr:hypothetical protein [Gemmatimonadaceae bacterium]
MVTAEDAVSVWPLLAPRVPADALILLKGSRGTRLERLVARLEAHAGLAPSTPAAPH